MIVSTLKKYAYQPLQHLSVISLHSENEVSSISTGLPFCPPLYTMQLRLALKWGTDGQLVGAEERMVGAERSFLQAQERNRALQQELAQARYRTPCYGAMLACGTIQLHAACAKLLAEWGRCA